MALYRQEVTSLPLPPSIRERLLRWGFRTVGDLEGVGPVDLASEAGLTQEEAVEVLKLSTSRGRWELTGAKSAWELYMKERQSRRIVTFGNDLDGILGGGVATGEVTEFCGVPGVGKTQIGIQLSVAVQLPWDVKGLGGAAVYIDTEGSFTVERAAEMAEAAVKHVWQIAAKTGEHQLQSKVAAFTVDSIMSNIHYFRVFDHVQQLAVTRTLPQYIAEHREVRLVVVDSVTFHFRQDFQDMAQRTRVLAQMAQDFMSLAEANDVAVVFMNQVTTKVLTGKDSKLVPALGDTWSHCASSRVILYWQGRQRYAHLYKSPYLPAQTAPYWVDKEGIRGRRHTEKRPG
eukprot:evm.model.scf_655.5 EVM.evm.TU.scf_655.5   scf_655:56748-63748(+)